MSSRAKRFNLNELKRLLNLGTEDKRRFYSVIIIAILLSVVSSARPLLTGNAIDAYILHKNVADLLKICVILGVIITMEIALQYYFILMSNIIAQTVIEKLRIQLFNKIIQYKLSFFDKTPNGTLVTRSVSDIETISQVFTDGILVVLGDVLRIVCIMAVMFYTNWKLALVVIVILPLMTVVTSLFQKSIKRTFSEERTQTAIFNSFVQERLSGMKIIQLFNREDAEFKKFKGINKKLRDAYLATVFYFSLLFPVVELVSSVALGLVIILGGWSAFYFKDVSPGEVIAFIMFIPMLVRPIRQMAERFNNLQRGLVSAERVFKMMDLDETIPNDGKVEKSSIQGNISFKNVVFEYIPDEEILKGISFKAKAGECIAIVGATGAGKSTIINLLSRFYDIKSGSICIDGVDIRDYNLQNLRSHIAVVLQDVFLFNDTILNNISLGDNNISENDIIQAAKEIDIHPFIETLPGGYYYKVSERGSTLSVGQRQLISFLRAYVHKPEILVLDEATSSIDTASEHLIQKATEKITKNRTSIIIAHRLATIQNADKIIVMEHGKIVEMGKHQELLNQNGYYAHLYKVQFRDAQA
ncbi:ABC transporter ATP-binding protein [Ornithobacterium rhinotracheale]|uniref:ABC transporter ATP-binding protein n=1 Tax=Ornithobacterium rhinotracheale TaxID=28251 RepID=UPI00129CC05A|nr:ABC transporter ATP-binding protein [Ornithobacterium rhinotracheale]MRJ10973.1 ABC transporter ATP-binding protein [Ornithobacterium rhinotracheale]